MAHHPELSNHKISPSQIEMYRAIWKLIAAGSIVTLGTAVSGLFVIGALNLSRGLIEPASALIGVGTCLSGLAVISIAAAINEFK